MNKILLLLLFISKIVFAQSSQNYHINIDSDKYNKILNTIFSLDTISKSDSGFYIVLRFEPTGGPESQIIIISEPGRTEIIKMKIKGEYGIQTQIYNFIEENKIKIEDPIELSNLIKIEKTSFVISQKKANKYLRSFSKTFKKTSSDLRKRERSKENQEKLFHGTVYEVMYADQGGDITCKISDTQITGTTKLTKWMNSVRLDVEKMK